MFSCVLADIEPLIEGALFMIAGAQGGRLLCFIREHGEGHAIHGISNVHLMLCEHDILVRN